VDAGFIEGYPDSTFHPNDRITRQEMAMLLSRILLKRFFIVPMNLNEI
jgi:hypothetical protein